MLAITGSDAFQWLKVCDKFTRFCVQIGGALLCGYAASIIMALISTISAYQVFRMYSPKWFLRLKNMWSLSIFSARSKNMKKSSSKGSIVLPLFSTAIRLMYYFPSLFYLCVSPRLKYLLFVQWKKLSKKEITKIEWKKNCIIFINKNRRRILVLLLALLNNTYSFLVSYTLWNKDNKWGVTKLNVE